MFTAPQKRIEENLVELDRKSSLPPFSCFLNLSRLSECMCTLESVPVATRTKKPRRIIKQKQLSTLEKANLTKWKRANKQRKTSKTKY